MKVKVKCKIDGTYWDEIVECHSYFIKEGAYIFCKKGGWGAYEYENVIKTFPVMFTIVELIE